MDIPPLPKLEQFALLLRTRGFWVSDKLYGIAKAVVGDTVECKIFKVDLPTGSKSLTVTELGLVKSEPDSEPRVTILEPITLTSLTELTRVLNNEVVVKLLKSKGE